MAQEYSFDIVSDYDRQELVNALDQTLREIRTRYDLKDTGSAITLDGNRLQLTSASEFTLQAVRDVLLQKAVKRNLSPKLFDYGKVEEASKGTVRQTALLRKGLSPEIARDITKLIRDNLPKLKTQIQGDAVRVTGRSKDELQAAMKLVREKDYPIPIQFENYR